MEPQNNQSTMTPEDAKASLGIATALQDQMMPTAPEETPQQTEEQAPTNQVTPDDVSAQVEGLESRILDEIKTLREEVKKDDTKKEFQKFKKEIEEILNGQEK